MYRRFADASSNTFNPPKARMGHEDKSSPNCAFRRTERSKLLDKSRHPRIIVTREHLLHSQAPHRHTKRAWLKEDSVIKSVHVGGDVLSRCKACAVQLIELKESGRFVPWFVEAQGCLWYFH